MATVAVAPVVAAAVAAERILGASWRALKQASALQIVCPLAVERAAELLFINDRAEISAYHFLLRVLEGRWWKTSPHPVYGHL